MCHLYILEKYKLVIFWSPRCGHKSIDRLLRYLGYEDFAKQTHKYRDITMEDIKDFKQVWICRNPYERFGSFLRWKKIYGTEITKEFVKDFLQNRIKEDELMVNDIHHSFPQWSQAIKLINKDIKVIDINNFDEFINLLSETTKTKLDKSLLVSDDKIFCGKESGKKYDVFQDKEIKELFDNFFKDDLENLPKYGIDCSLPDLI